MSGRVGRRLEVSGSVSHYRLTSTTAVTRSLASHSFMATAVYCRRRARRLPFWIQSDIGYGAAATVPEFIVSFAIPRHFAHLPCYLNGLPLCYVCSDFARLMMQYVDVVTRLLGDH